MKQESKKSFDGATLSKRLKPKQDAPVSLPIGKPSVAAVARRYKHAAGKSSTYAPEVVDMIYRMSREGDLDDQTVCEFVGAKLLAERESPDPQPPVTWDQLVFLSANLTRLVIDPYREKCNSQVTIGSERARPLPLDWPVIFGGIDFTRIPDALLSHTLAAATEANLALLVRPSWRLDNAAKSNPIFCVDIMKSPAEMPDAAAVVLTAPLAGQLTGKSIAPMIKQIRQQTDGQIPVGVVAPAINSSWVVDQTIQLELDFYLADAQWTGQQAPGEVLPELGEAPSIRVLADVVDRLRHHRKEELVQVIYHGGIRGGADAGKALCLGASAVTIGLATVLGMGFRIARINDEASLLKELEYPLERDDAIRRIINVAKSINTEVTMLARASGKSSVKNMEPEDLRALTIGTSAATGIPVAGKDFNFRREEGMAANESGSVQRARNE